MSVSEPIYTTTPDEQVERAHAKRTLDEILATLDDDKRAVFVLFEIEGVPMQEVAEVIGCPLQTTYYRLSAARKVVEERIRVLRDEEAKR